MNNEKLKKIIVILGPTASGKSALAVHLAQKIGGEIISADSRQVYKGLDIGTGKVTKKEMGGVPHYLLSIADPRRAYSAARYKKDAEKALKQITLKNKIPIICGGTGFYIDTLLGVFSLPNVPANQKLRSVLSKKSKDELIAILTVLDKSRAKTVDKQNPVRLIRAIEIATAIGRVPQTEKQSKKYDVLKIGIRTPVPILRKKISSRLGTRIKAGMIDEVKRLGENGLSYGRMEELGLEYRYISRYLKNKITKEEMIKKLETEIRRYAKRQMTWFKRDKNINWISNFTQAQKIANRFLNK